MELNVSAPKSDVLFINKCCVKNKIKKSPESAIATLRAIEELSIPEFDIIVVFVKKLYKNRSNQVKLQPFRHYL